MFRLSFEAISQQWMEKLQSFCVELVLSIFVPFDWLIRCEGECNVFCSWKSTQSSSEMLKPQIDEPIFIVLHFDLHLKVGVGMGVEHFNEVGKDVVVFFSCHLMDLSRVNSICLAYQPYQVKIEWKDKWVLLCVYAIAKSSSIKTAIEPFGFDNERIQKAYVCSNVNDSFAKTQNCMRARCHNRA